MTGAGVTTDRARQVHLALAAFVGVALLAWRAVGPWPRFAWSDVAQMLAWPVAWGLWIVLLGELSSWYPYGFVDVDLHGYGDVAVSFVGIVGFAVMLGALFTVIDRLRHRAASAPAP